MKPAKNNAAKKRTLRRHPGSALKPFVYALAIEAGESPATIAADVRDVDSRYRVTKVTQKERGAVRYREALAGSYNLAAVEVLNGVGVPALLERLRSLGLSPLAGTSHDYSLDLALGSARVRLLDLAAAYGFLVSAGRVALPTALADQPPRFAPGEFSPAASWLVMDMLSDPDARRAVFGASPSNARIALEVRARARSSNTCPSSTSTVIAAAASKYTATRAP